MNVTPDYGTTGGLRAWRTWEAWEAPDATARPKKEVLIYDLLSLSGPLWLWTAPAAAAAAADSCSSSDFCSGKRGWGKWHRAASHFTRGNIRIMCECLLMRAQSVQPEADGVLYLFCKFTCSMSSIARLENSLKYSKLRICAAHPDKLDSKRCKIMYHIF